MGYENEIVVDNPFNPKIIYGIADGYGDFKKGNYEKSNHIWCWTVVELINAWLLLKNKWQVEIYEKNKIVGGM